MFSKKKKKKNKNLQLLVIWNLLAGLISYSAELSMKKSFITSRPGPDNYILRKK